MPDKSGVSKLLWTVGHPVDAKNTARATHSHMPECNMQKSVFVEMGYPLNISWPVNNLSAIWHAREIIVWCVVEDGE